MTYIHDRIRFPERIRLARTYTMHSAFFVAIGHATSILFLGGDSRPGAWLILGYAVVCAVLFGVEVWANRRRDKAMEEAWRLESQSAAHD